MSDRFEELLRRNLGCAVILAGSDSDRPHIIKILASLRPFEIPTETRIISAHKQPTELLDILRYFDNLEGALAYIAVAGGTDAMSGTVSYNTHRPTISCPPDPPNESCLRNPPGSSNVTLYRPENVGRAVAQMFSSINSLYKRKIREGIIMKNEALREADKKLRKELSWYEE